MGFPSTPENVATGHPAQPGPTSAGDKRRETAAGALAAFLLTGATLVAAVVGFVAAGGPGRIVELLVLGAGALAAYACGWRFGRFLVVVVVTILLLLESHYGRIDGGHEWSVLLLVLGGGVTTAASSALRDRFDAWNRGRPSRPEASPVPRTVAELESGSLEFALLRSLREHEELCLLLAPDDVEEIVRKHGNAGRIVLDRVSETLRTHLRATDVLFRQGLYEFWVILPEATVDAARMTAERIRLAVLGEHVPTGGGEAIRLSLSVGIAASPIDGRANGPLVEAAKLALAAAIANGGNRTLLHSIPPGVPPGWGLEQTPLAAQDAVLP